MMFANVPGMTFFLEAVQGLRQTGHVVLRTPSRGGAELTTELMYDNNKAIEEVRMTLVKKA